MPNENIYSKRYATEEMNDIFCEKNKILLERDLWIAVMKAQKELGLDIPQEDILKFEYAKENIDLDYIASIEKRTKHDVKARIEGFVKAAGAHEHIHKGMTSRDLTDNVEQMQIISASKIIFGKYVSVLRHMANKAAEYDSIILAARTHHQPAQPTLLGKRFAMWAEELYHHLVDFEGFINDYPMRGIKGPVGTQFDMATLLGSNEKAEKLEQIVAKTLGFNKVMDAVGQVYPRSLDYSLISKLSALSSACENFSTGMRLMSGYELVTEGFKDGQVGSSAMPHKMNTKNSERIFSLCELLKMHADGASRLSGAQWEEGDVSCSALRRGIIPDAFYVSDGICETTLNVLNDLGAYPVMIDKELDRYLPFLATTEILMASVKAGMGREKAHEIIRKYSVEDALNMRNYGTEPQLSKKLAECEEFRSAGITEETLDCILRDKKHFAGLAREQIGKVIEKTNSLFERYPNQSLYEPKQIV